MKKAYMLPAIFIDRDGVINQNRADYVRSWDQIEILPNALSALALLAASPYRLIMVTNQSPIGRGILTRDQVRSINHQLIAHIESHRGRIDAVYVCPHHPDDNCDCRKPKPGLLNQAARDHNLDLDRSYFIGDALSDVQAALAANCQPILVLTGRGRRQQRLLKQNGYTNIPVLPDLSAAAVYILNHHRP
jgi:D-glycero-D-manno-heptose 1,7-bisphosphate phosphatase